MSFRVPTPPGPQALDPILLTWDEGRPLVRCHDVRFGATEFNPGVGLGRFHPFEEAHRQLVPVLYASSDFDGALSETFFHDVPIRGPGKWVEKFELESLVVSTLVCDRDLKLAQLFGHGLSRIGVSRQELIECGAEEYTATAAWARALHSCGANLDGLVWVSRQNDAAHALVLFGDRVPRRELRIASHPVALYVSPGFDAVQEAAEKAGILILD